VQDFQSHTSLLTEKARAFPLESSGFFHDTAGPLPEIHSIRFFRCFCSLGAARRQVVMLLSFALFESSCDVAHDGQQEGTKRNPSSALDPDQRSSSLETLKKDLLKGIFSLLNENATGPPIEQVRDDHALISSGKRFLSGVLACGRTLYESPTG
jgi:hypothetical protein